MRNFKKLIAAALASVLSVVCGVVAPISNVLAEDSSSDSDRPAVWMQVSPTSNRVILKAGEELTYLFTVENIGTEDINFKVYTVPYNIVDEDYNVNFSNLTNRTQISRWIQFRTTPVLKDGSSEGSEYASEATFSLPAPTENERSYCNIEYKVKVPDDVPAGGQYAAIVSEYVPDESSGGGGVQTIPRVNMVVYGTTYGDTQGAAEINEHELPGFLTDGNIRFTSLVSNKGNTDFSAIYEFKVEGLFGGTDYEKTTPYDILPDTSRRVDFEWEGTPMFGIFRVTNTITALDEVSVQSKIVLKVPFFVIIILILMLTMLVAWVIILIRKRQTKKSRVIV